MRVLKIREFTYPTYVGGIETCLHTLCPALVKLGVKITLLTCAQKSLPEHENKDGVEIRRIDFLGLISALTSRLKVRGTLYGIITRLIFLLISPVHIIKAVKEANIDIIHVHCLCALSALPASIASLLTGKPLIITMHGTFLGYYNKVMRPPLSWIISAVERAYLRLKLYHKILVEDKYTWITLMKLGIQREKVSILPYPGIDLEKFRLAQPTKNLCGETIIMHHGRLVQKRGIKTLIEVMPKVLKEYPSVKLIIAGEGSEKERLKRLAEDLGVSENVCFLGLIPYESIPSLIKSSTIIVVPSLIEGHSASVVEAMAAGKPVVATRVGGIIDVIKDGETGILVKPENPDEMAEAIIRLLKDKELARTLSKKAQESVRKYEVGKLAEKEISEYKNLMRGEGGFKGRTNITQIIKIIILMLATLGQIPYVLPSLTNLAYRIAHIRNELLYGWIALSVCVFWLALKWRFIARDVFRNERVLNGRIHALTGLTLCIISLLIELLYIAEDFFMAAIPVSVFISGIFTALGSLIPLAISGAYAAGILIPSTIGALANKPLSEFAANITVLVLRALNVRASAAGAYITIPTVTGGPINAHIDHVCAGSTSLSVFTCLFILITIDLQPKLDWKAAALFAVGCLGTLAQAMLRLILMGVIGANYGLEAFLAAHKYLGYILFPLYFMLFVYLYIRSTRGG